MKKHKFSDKLPEVGKKIVAKVEGDVDIFIVRTSEFIDFPRLYRFRQTKNIGDNVYFLDDELMKLIWWADPEEEEDLGWKSVETNPPACDGRYLAYPNTTAEVGTALFNKEADRWIDLEDHTEPWRPRLWRETGADPIEFLPEEEE